MAVYPAFGQDISSTVTILDDVLLDRASNGKPRMRRLFNTLLKEFVVNHLVTVVDKGTMGTFYDTNRNLSFTFVWNPEGTTHTCMFSTAPTYTMEGSKDFWRISNNLIEV